MKVIKKNVYYCDFCKKKSLRSLKRHEERCTQNPNRRCGMCDIVDLNPILDSFEARFVLCVTVPKYDPNGETEHWRESISEVIEPIWKDEFAIQDIQEAVDNCPACILAVIRCLGLNYWYFQGRFKYDFKAARGDWWDATNKENLRREIYY